MKYLFIIRTNLISKTIQKYNSLTISDLKEKNWYQICIAAIGENTGEFVCKQLLTDFFVTGPVTNAVVKSEIDNIFISWSKPNYEHDIPQGYVVHLKGPHNFCRTVNIKMVNLRRDA